MRVFVPEPALGVTVLVMVALMVAFIIVPLGYVEQRATIHRQFTVDDARVKLQRLYPS